MVVLGVLNFINMGCKMNNGADESLKWTNITDGMKQASTAKKKMLVDVYTDWCGWCKKMEKDTYGDDCVKNYLAQNYVLIRLNAESDSKETVGNEEVTQADIASAFRVDGYPTTVFLTADGQRITSVPGYMKPAEFLQVLKYIGENYYEKMNFQDYLNSQSVPAK